MLLQTRLIAARVEALVAAAQPLPPLNVFILGSLNTGLEGVFIQALLPLKHFIPKIFGHVGLPAIDGDDEERSAPSEGTK